MKRIKKRIIGLLLAIVMLVSLAPLSASANSTTITIDGTVQYSRAFEMLDTINAYREEKGLSALVMDQVLLDAAVVRSAELAVRGETFYRPNGERYDWVYPMSISDAYTNVGNDSSSTFIYSYKDDYLSNSDYSGIGISIFAHNGKDYIYAILSDPSGAPAEQPEDQIITQEIDIGTLEVTISLSGEDKMEAGSQQELILSQKNAYKSYKRFYAIWNNDSLNWTSSDPAVATVHDGVVAALSAGTVEITAQAGANTATFTVTVEGEAAHVHSMKYIERIEPTYYENGRDDYWICTLCDHMYQEEAAVTEVTAEELVIPKLTCSEHAWDDGTVTKAPASSKEGNILYVCVTCSAERNDPIPVNGKIAMHSGDLNAEKPTVAQLNARFNGLTTTTNRFAEEPSSVAPYKAGRVTDELLNSGLIYLNYLRYMAGLPDAKLSDEWNDIAQHGAVLLGAVDYLSHTPSRPADMDEAFYQKGSEGTNFSNISVSSGGGTNFNPLMQSLLDCMNDCVGLDNLTRVGHRRWLLNPAMEQVGFGFAKSAQGNLYMTTKVFAQGGVRESRINYDFISWPASGNMASNVFARNVPWSITLNPEIYNNPDLDQIKITLTRVEDNTVWVFDKNTDGPVSNEEQYLSLDYSGTGVSNCMVFSPGSRNITEYAGTYLVSVEGLQYKNGSPASLYYEVEFSKLTKCDHTEVAHAAQAPTCTESGWNAYVTCSKCDYTTKVVIPAGHSFSDGLCSVCGKAEDEISSGTCGENSTWTLDNNGVLTISGTGEVTTNDWIEYSNQITEIIIEEGITSICRFAFSNCNKVTTVTLPAGYYGQEPYVFEGCSGLTEILVAEGNEHFISVDGVLFSADGTSLIYCPGGKVGEYTIPNGVTKLNDAAFMGCDKLTTVNVAEGITEIPFDCFYGCSSLTELNLPSTLTAITGLQPLGGVALTSLTIPENVTTIASGAFFGCDELTELIMKPTTPPRAQQNVQAEDGTMKYLDGITISVPCEDGVLEAYQTDVRWSEYADQMVLWHDYTNRVCTVCGDTENESSSPTIIGDSDGNGTVDMFDAKMVLEHYAGLEAAQNINLSVSDVDNNEVVDMFDAKMILEYYAGIITQFPGAN